jgi:acetone carboxylase gamma subunit
MTRDETNGMLRAVVIQLRAVEEALAEIDRKGGVADPAWDPFRELKLAAIDLTAAAERVRAWNL